jgi:methionyl-tRNA formyltransferase
VIHADHGVLIVAAGKGAVRIEYIQPAGKKMMSIHDFLCGHSIKPGEKLGN